MSICYNNPEKSSSTKINKHTSSGYSLFTHSSVDTPKNKIDYYRGKNCVKNFCLDPKDHATKIINYEKKEMIPLTKNVEKMHNKQKRNVIYAKQDLALTSMELHSTELHSIKITLK